MKIVVGIYAQDYHPPIYRTATREKPSSSAGFRYISGVGARATNTELWLTGSSSEGATRATTTSVSSSVDTTHATTN